MTAPAFSFPSDTKLIKVLGKNSYLILINQKFISPNENKRTVLIDGVKFEVFCSPLDKRREMYFGLLNIFPVKTEQQFNIIFNCLENMALGDGMLIEEVKKKAANMKSNFKPELVKSEQTDNLLRKTGVGSKGCLAGNQDPRPSKRSEGLYARIALQPQRTGLHRNHPYAHAPARENKPTPGSQNTYQPYQCQTGPQKHTIFRSAQGFCVFNDPHHILHHPPTPQVQENVHQIEANSYIRNGMEYQNNRQHTITNDMREPITQQNTTNVTYNGVRNESFVKSVYQHGSQLPIKEVTPNWGLIDSQSSSNRHCEYKPVLSQNPLQIYDFNSFYLQQLMLCENPLTTYNQLSPANCASASSPTVKNQVFGDTYHLKNNANYCDDDTLSAEINSFCKCLDTEEYQTLQDILSDDSSDCLIIDDEFQDFSDNTTY